MQKQSEMTAMVITLLLSVALGFFSVLVIKEYGWLVFVFIPVLIGYLPPVLVGRKYQISKSRCYQLGFCTLGLAIASLLLFAVEGLICIIMSAPIILLGTWLGAYLGFKTFEDRWIDPKNAMLGILLLGCGTMNFDYLKESANLIPVKTRITVEAPIAEVWTNVVTFGKIEKPTDWIFKTGISCPTDATIKGTGVGAIRYCNFTTGSFVEPITTWEEPTLLQFDVIEQPIPMNEYNPFWDIQPPHLDGYFLSKRGQFRLREISPTQTELEGTTWYELHIFPQLYWKVWSDFIIHRIHQRVLNHIKSSTEK